jgi:hypothetical protein
MVANIATRVIRRIAHMLKVLDEAHGRDISSHSFFFSSNFNAWKRRKNFICKLRDAQKKVCMYRPT